MPGSPNELLGHNLFLRWATSRWLIGLAGRVTRGGSVCQGPDGRPAVALTFDDGPDPRWTPVVLDVLARENARATFFCVGGAAERHPGLVRRAAAAGHEIGTHLWEHRRETVFDNTRFDVELARSRALLSDLAGAPIRYLRFPYGRHGRQHASKLAPLGVVPVHWTASSHDTRASHADEIVDWIRSTIRPGAILLFHDGIADETNMAPIYAITRDATLRALPGVLGLLRSRQLEPVTLTKLMEG